jgi:hypothetical protein
MDLNSSNTRLSMGLPLTSQQMSVAARTAQMLGETSYWVSPSKNAVIGLFLYSPYPFPNSPYPYQFRMFVYTPSYTFLADTKQYLAGVGVDGKLNATEFTYGMIGTLLNKDQLMWNDGSMWVRTQPPANRSINQYDALTAYNQAAKQSADFSALYERAYPNLVKYLPWG